MITTTTTTATRLASLRAELLSLEAENRQMGRLTLEDHEDISDLYQAKLEMSWALRDLRDEIASLTQSSNA